MSALYLPDLVFFNGLCQMNQPGFPLTWSWYFFFVPSLYLAGIIQKQAKYYELLPHDNNSVSHDYVTGLTFVPHMLSHVGAAPSE